MGTERPVYIYLVHVALPGLLRSRVYNSGSISHSSSARAPFVCALSATWWDNPESKQVVNIGAALSHNESLFHSKSRSHRWRISTSRTLYVGMYLEKKICVLKVGREWNSSIRTHRLLCPWYRHKSATGGQSLGNGPRIQDLEKLEHLAGCSDSMLSAGRWLHQ